MATQRYGPFTISAASGAGSVLTFECRDSGEAVVQSVGAQDATVQFEATVDTTNWFALLGTPVAGGADVSSYTSAGRWRFNTGGLVKMRIRCSTYVSGSPSVSVGLTPGIFGQQGASIAATVTGSVDVVTSVVPGTGATHLGKAEDAAHTTGDVGVMALAVQKATPADVSTDGDYAPLQVSGGYLYTHPKNIVNEDVAFAAAGPLGMAGAVRTHTPANTSGTDGDAEPLQVENGLLWSQDRGPSRAFGVSSAVFSSADASTAAAVTDAPTAGQKICPDWVSISTVTALTVDLEEETTATIIWKAVLAANAAPVILDLRGIKLATADKKLMFKASGAGQVYVLARYHSEA